VLNRESMHERSNLVLPLFCLAAVVANQAIFRLGAMPPVWALILLLTLALLYQLVPQFDATMIGFPPKHLTAASVAIGLLALAPVFADLIIGWNREFPYSGDAYFHVGQSYRIALWWLSPVASVVVKVPTLDDVRHLVAHPLGFFRARIVLLAVLAVATVVLYRRWRMAAFVFATVSFMAWGFAEATIFLRYPGARYLLDLPFLGPAFALNDLELAGRLSNVVAAIAWLFVLRPWLIGRWPDLAVLPVALLLLWHKDVIHYFDSVYLEPAGLIFALLAAELLIVKGRDSAPVACLLIGVAATVKEPFVLALPFMWLAGEPWRRDWRHFLQLSGATVAAGLPFVFYVAARRSIDIADLGSNRSVQLDVSVEGLSNYVHGFAEQIGLAFPTTSGVVAIGALLVILVMFVLKPDRRIILVCLVGAGCLIAALFMVDRISQRWAGYFRFVMYSLPFLTGGVLLLSQALPPRWALAVGGVVLLLQVPSTYTALAFALGPPAGRNFTEYTDSPLVFPIKSLTVEAHRAGVLPPRALITANLVDGSLRALPGSNIVFGPVGELYCSCEASHPNVLALFVRFTNMSSFLKDHPAPPGERFGIWQKTNAQREACLIDLKGTCGHVFTRFEAGELVGAIGTQR
jgi:hypothetical protein